MARHKSYRVKYAKTRSYIATHEVTLLHDGWGYVLLEDDGTRFYPQKYVDVEVSRIELKGGGTIYRAA